jgi:tetratricopeptide (TPR) repeat protein
MLDKFTKKELKDLQAIYAKAVAFDKSGMLAEAARSYRFFLSKWPEPAAYYNYGLILKKMQDFDGALLNYEKAIALKPDYAEAYANIGSIYLERAAYAQSLEQYEKAIQHNPALVPAHYNRGVVLQKLGRPDDALAAYNRALMLQPQFYLAYLNAGSIYLEKAEFGKALDQFNKAIHFNPGLVEAYCNRGVVFQKMRQYDDALGDYRTALALQPNYAPAHAHIGNVHLETGAYEEALGHYGAAIKHNPMYVEAYYNRGVALQELRWLDEALVDNEKALALDPHYYLALLNKSVILSELKRKTEAIGNYERMLAVNPENDQARLNLGFLKLSLGDFATGWMLNESRLQLHGESYSHVVHWRRGENIAGKTVFIKWEQGFGDTIQFCRFARVVKDAGAHVILSVQEPLKRIIASLDDRIVVVGEQETPEKIDYCCYTMSLPHLLDASVETIPYPARYLNAETSDMLKWQARLREISGRKIGLVWAGGHRPHIQSARRNDADRSLGLRHFLPLLEVEGTAFFSLQKGPPAAQLAALEGGHIRDVTDELTDFADTGALIETLDLVISVDTSVAHLAAALGKPVWILVPFVSCWRWLEGRTDTPWYASVKLFRQDEHGNWDRVMAEVKQELETFVAGRNPLNVTP